MAAPTTADAAEEGGSQSAGVLLSSVLTRMRTLVDRMALCGLGHFDLQGEMVLTSKDKNGPYHHAIATFVHATVEALLDHAIICHVDSTGGDGDDAVCMATQVGGTQGAAAPFGNEDPAVEAARRLFVLGSSVRDLLQDCKLRLKPLAPWLHVELSLPACCRVLAALQTEAAAQGCVAGPSAFSQRGKTTTSRRFARHVLKAIANRTSHLSASAGTAGGGGEMCGANLRPSSGSGDGDALLGDARSILSSMLALMPHAEAMSDREAPSGMLNSLLGGAGTPSRKPVKSGKGAAGKSGAKGKAAEGGDARPKAERVKSRLLLLLDAVDGCVAFLAARGANAELASAFSASVGASHDDDETMAEAGESGAGGGGGRGKELVAALTCYVHPLAERMLQHASYAEAEATMRLAFRLASLLGPASLAAPLAWSAARVDDESVEWLTTGKALLAYHLTLARRAAPAGAPLHAISCRVLQALGDNTDQEVEDEVDGPSGYALLTEGAASALTAPLLDALATEILDLERALTVLKRKPAASMPAPPAAVEDLDEASNARLGALETALGARERQMLSVLRVLCKATLEAGHAHAVLKNCGRMFRHLTTLFKWLPTTTTAPEYVEFTPLVRPLCGEESLSSAMYGLIAFLGTSETAGAAKREAKLIPELVYTTDRFENTVVALSAKCKDGSLLAQMKKATARDFRIQAGEVSQKLKALEKEAAVKEGKKRQRAERKTEAKSGKKKARGAGARAEEQAVPEPGPAEEGGEEDDEDEDEDEDEGEGEGEDAYPASMIGDDDEEEDDDDE